MHHQGVACKRAVVPASVRCAAQETHPTKNGGTPVASESRPSAPTSGSLNTAHSATPAASLAAARSTNALSVASASRSPSSSPSSSASSAAALPPTSGRAAGAVSSRNACGSAAAAPAAVAAPRDAPRCQKRWPPRVVFRFSRTHLQRQQQAPWAFSNKDVTARVGEECLQKSWRVAVRVGCSHLGKAACASALAGVETGSG